MIKAAASFAFVLGLEGTSPAAFSLSSGASKRYRYERPYTTRISALIYPFDFSSRKGWDDFYSGTDPDGGTFEYDWHPSIPHASVASEIAPGGRCLMMGCGSSALPRALFDAHDGATRVCCLDYSPVCAELMRKRHGPDRPGMSFVCADALNLGAVAWENVFGDGEVTFDAIVDKGLIDALMCGDAWDYDVSRLFRGLSGILREDGGIYVLVSFKLAQSTKEFLTEMGENYGLEWDFDVPDKSNNKVSFSIGRRKL